MNTIKITLNDLRFYAYHGVMEQEATIGNEFGVDIEVCIPSSKLEQMVSENVESLDETISYAEIFDIVKDEMSNRSQLLETVAIRIANALQKTYPMIISGNVRIKKIAPPIPSCNGSAAVNYRWEI